MRIGRVSLIVTLTAVLVVGATGVANAAAVHVTGTITEVSPGTCGDFEQRGKIFSFQCEGLIDTWTGGISGTGVFDEAVSINVVSGELLVSGTETFVGCVGDKCGTLEWVYQGSGKVDLQGMEILFINGEQRFTGGNGGLAGAHGSVRFSKIGENPAAYDGFIVLQ